MLCALKQEAPIFKDSSNKDDHGHKESASRGIGATIYKHLMSGVSNMLPFVIGGGILIALGFLFGYNAHDPNDPSYNIIAEALNTIGGGNAFALMVPVLAGFIAMSIGWLYCNEYCRSSRICPPGMVGGMMAATSGAGFLGGLVAGFLGGYIVVGIRKLLAGLPSSLEGIKTILLFPLLGIAITGFIMHFVVNTPLSALNTWISNWLSSLGTANAVLLGVILGLMMAIDMGGPILTKLPIFLVQDLLLVECMSQWLPLWQEEWFHHLSTTWYCPSDLFICIALATFLFKNKFSKQEREAGPVNIVMGLSFITEGAIPSQRERFLLRLLTRFELFRPSRLESQLWQEVCP